MDLGTLLCVRVSCAAAAAAATARQIEVLELVINEVEAPLESVSLFASLKCVKLSNRRRRRLVLSPLGEKSDGASWLRVRDKEDDKQKEQERLR